MPGCTFNGVEYPDGHDLAKDGHCIQVICEGGMWYSGGAVEPECK